MTTKDSCSLEDKLCVLQSVEVQKLLKTLGGPQIVHEPQTLNIALFTLLEFGFDSDCALVLPS